ncbi:MAG: hypothetical protein IJS31_02285 [Oscillospiraceae bacterium]|nr:hypothetical protein [Oscillospiraceae bacterium]
MKRILTILLTLVLIFSLCIPAFAEPQYVTTIFSHPEKDEEYWDRMFELEKEQDWEVNGLPAYDGPELNVPDPTPEEIAARKEQAQKLLEEVKEWDRIRMSDDSEQNTKMMSLVFGDKRNDLSDLPESTFTGGFEEFAGANGSTTRVYENGSIETKYADGTWEGLDQNGNHYTEDKSGNRTIAFINGDVGTVGKDDSIRIKQTDGSTVTYNADGTSTWTNDTGLVIKYDEYGTYQSIGFEDGESVDLVYGQFPPGDQKITGPKGAYIEWHNGIDSKLTEDGTSIDTGDGLYGFTIRGVNGETGKLSTDAAYNSRIDEAATIAEKQKTNGQSGTSYTSDTRYDISSMGGGGFEILVNNNDSDQISVTYEDPDGNVYTDKKLAGGMLETSYESADGKTGFRSALDENGLNVTRKENGVEQKVAETVQNEDGSVSIKFENGASLTMGEDGAIFDLGNSKRITLDKDGNPKELTGDGDSVIWGNDGNIISAHLTAEDGSVLTVDGDNASVTLPDGGSFVISTDENGVRTVTLPDGSVRKQDENGNWNLSSEAPDAEATKPDAETPVEETPAEAPADTGFSGCYYGTYEYTAYWDGGKVKQGNRAYYVYEYNGCYYLIQSKNPTEIEAIAAEDGVEALYNNYYDDKLVIEGASFDPATNTATYSERSYLNDVQYIAETTTITFDGNGGITVKWDSQNVYGSGSEPQESGTFTGTKG